MAEEGLAGAVAGSGLIPSGSTGVLMLSGGADSCALAFGLAGVCGPDAIVALHINYSLRPESSEDEAAARAVCDQIGVELRVSRPERRPEGRGNLHAWARDFRYAAAEQLRARRGLDWIAVAHTRSDLAETVLYRLATSPGTRALAAMPERRGNVVRPLLALTRAQVRAAAEDAGLPFVDDRSNEDRAFARSRIRHELLPVLEELNPSSLAAIAATRAELGEELDFINLAASALIDGRGQIEARELEAAHPALRRHALRLLAERELGRPVAFSRDQTRTICDLAGTPEGGSIDLGGEDSLVAEAGLVAVAPAEGSARAASAGIAIPVPGRGSWQGWSISAEEMAEPFMPEGPEVATLDADLLGDRIEVRGWREGDRIRPLGMTGSKSLQDLFTDARVRRSLRRQLPVLLSGDEVVWLPGLAVADRFRLGPGTRRAMRITARQDPPDADGAPASPPGPA